MNRFLEGAHTIGFLRPTPIIINSPNAFLSVSKSFEAVANNINKAIIECGKNAARRTSKNNG